MPQIRLEFDLKTLKMKAEGIGFQGEGCASEIGTVIEAFNSQVTSIERKPEYVYTVGINKVST